MRYAAVNVRPILLLFFNGSVSGAYRHVKAVGCEDQSTCRLCFFDRDQFVNVKWQVPRRPRVLKVSIGRGRRLHVETAACAASARSANYAVDGPVPCRAASNGGRSKGLF